MTGLISLGVCTANGVESALEAKSGCHFIPDMCNVQTEVKEKKQEVLNILAGLEDVDKELTALISDYEATLIHFESWTETLDFISDVHREIEKIGRKQPSLWGIDLKIQSALDKAQQEFEQGLKNILSSHQMTITNSALAGAGFFSSAAFLGLKEKNLQDEIVFLA